MTCPVCKIFTTHRDISKITKHMVTHRLQSMPSLSSSTYPLQSMPSTPPIPSLPALPALSSNHFTAQNFNSIPNTSAQNTSDIQQRLHTLEATCAVQAEQNQQLTARLRELQDAITNKIVPAIQQLTTQRKPHHHQPTRTNQGG